VDIPIESPQDDLQYPQDDDQSSQKLQIRSQTLPLPEVPHLLGGLGNPLLPPLVLHLLHFSVQDVAEAKAVEGIKGRSRISGDEGHNVDKGREGGVGI
jgi:hypothetical protein